MASGPGALFVPNVNSTTADLEVKIREDPLFLIKLVLYGLYQRGGVQWDQLGYSGVQWDQLGYNGVQWDQLGYSGVQWDQLGYNGVQWDQLGYNGVQWGTVGSSVIIIIPRPRIACKRDTVVVVLVS